MEKITTFGEIPVGGKFIFNGREVSKLATDFSETRISRGFFYNAIMESTGEYLSFADTAVVRAIVQEGKKED